MLEDIFFATERLIIKPLETCDYENSVSGYRNCHPPMKGGRRCEVTY